MRKLIGQRYIIRQNLIALIGFCLFCYFSWHIVMGERSLMRLYGLERSITKLSKQHEELHIKRADLEHNVQRLRPGSIDPDLLEERARYVLGYVHPDESVLLGFNN
jgi:cell division protein FtsB